MTREKICAVLGLARAGVPAAKFLVERGAQVVGYDSRPLEQLSDEARALETLGVELRTGEHNYAGLERCGTIVLSPGLKLHHEPLKSVLERCEARGADIIGELELAARHCRAPMIAVTGTKGKSTTTKLIHEMLLACGLKSVRAGNTGTPLIAELPNLTPDSWAVVEVSSFQLERAPTFKPRIAVLLNLLPDHLDYHPTLEQYWATKLKIFAKQGRSDVAVFNMDDASAREYSRSIADGLFYKGVQLIGVSGRERQRVGVKDGVLGWQPEHVFAPLIQTNEIPLSGEHNIANVAAAWAAAWAAASGGGGRFDSWMDEHREVVADAIRNFQPLPHRLEPVGEVNGVRWINDSQATIPEAAIAALRAFPAPVALICGGKAKLENPDAFDELGRELSQRAVFVATIGDASARIADAARRAGMSEENIIEAGTLDVAVEKCAEKMAQGGTVVMSPACASFDQFASFEARGEAFRALVSKLIHTR